MTIRAIVALTTQLIAADPNVTGVDGNCNITYNNPPTANEQTSNAAICSAFVEPAATRVVSVDALFNLFTPAEQAAVLANPQAHLQLIKWITRGVIDLNSPAAQTAFNGMVTLNILTPARATALLATPGVQVPQ
jgi:hypothetical protein